MSRPIRIARKRSALAISAFLVIASGMHYGGWGYLVKKTMGYTERDAMRRKAYLRLRERYRRRGKEFIYIDESGFEPFVTRRHAYAPKGQRVYGLNSGHRRPRTSLIAARVGETFEAPFLFEGTCNAEIFNAWLEEHLCPRLNENHVVVMDNAPFHKSTKTQELIAAKNATLLSLPPYSPDLNPIEHDFASIKAIREYNEHETLDNIIRTYK
jgi:transposase